MFQELIHEQIKQPGPTGSIIHQRGCAGNITLFDTNQCAIPKIVWSKCLICTMVKLRIEDEFCLLLLIKGSIQLAKVTCKAIPHKAIKKERGSQDSLLKTVLWTSVHGTFQRQGREKMQNREQDTHLMPTGIWDSAEVHSRVWEGSCNLPGRRSSGWERGRRNSHGFLLRPCGKLTPSQSNS